MSATEKRWMRPLLAGLAALTMAACAPSVSPTPADPVPAAEAPATATVAPAAAEAPATATVAPAAVERTGAATPEEAARSYYEWYLEYTRPDDEGGFKNPLVDEAYASSPYLTVELTERVADIVASFEGGGYDPFLCAQDVPTAFTVGPAEVAGDEARLTVYTTFVGHAFDVSLVEEDGGWLLDEVSCTNPDPTARTPEEVVDRFYSWWIHYPGNPLADQMYQGAGLYLTQDFIEEVTETIASFDGGGFDPILLAQDVPEAIVAEPAELDGDTAMVSVSTTFQGHTFTVRLMREGAIWKIDGVIPAGEVLAEVNGPEAGALGERADWNVYRLGRFDVQVMYPADWEAQEARLQDPRSVYPIVHVTTFGPEGVEGRQMVASLEIVEGTLEDVVRACSLEADALEAAEVAGQAMHVGRNAHGETLYILQAPYNEAVWGVLRDTMNWDDPSEEDRALKEVIAGMAETLVFAR